MLALVHRYRREFVLLNGLAIVGFAAASVVLGERFWALLGVDAGSSPLIRLLGWYLLVHGVAAVLVARAPEKQPVVVAAVGLEKVGAAICFFVLRSSIPLVALGVFDAGMAAVFLAYAVWLSRRSPG